MYDDPSSTIEVYPVPTPDSSGHLLRNQQDYILYLSVIFAMKINIGSIPETIEQIDIQAIRPEVKIPEINLQNALRYTNLNFIITDSILVGLLKPLFKKPGILNLTYTTARSRTGSAN